MCVEFLFKASVKNPSRGLIQSTTTRGGMSKYYALYRFVIGIPHGNFNLMAIWLRIRLLGPVFVSDGCYELRRVACKWRCKMR